MAAATYKSFVRTALRSRGMTRHFSAHGMEPCERQWTRDLIEARRALAAKPGGRRAKRARRRRKRIMARWRGDG